MKKIFAVIFSLITTNALAESEVILSHNAVTCDDPKATFMVAQGENVIGKVNFNYYLSNGNCIEYPKGTKVSLGSFIEVKIPAEQRSIMLKPLPDKIIRIASVTGLKELHHNYSIHHLMQRAVPQNAADLQYQIDLENQALTSYVMASDLIYSTRESIGP